MGIVGSGDYINALGFLNRFSMKNTVGARGEFLRQIFKWQSVASSVINRQMGFVKGTITHKYHGSINNRGFLVRNNITASSDFPYKPKEHVFYAKNGLLKFKPKVRNYFNNKTIRYFISRREDN
jgi:hypothetical protein